MIDYVRKFRQVLEHVCDALSLHPPDTFDLAHRLLLSENQDDRIAGLRRLEHSRDPRAHQLALVHYRFATTIDERFLAEDCLVRLTERHHEVAGDTAVAILRTQSRWSERFLRHRFLECSARNLESVLAITQEGCESRTQLNQILLSWCSKLPVTSSNHELKILNTLSRPWSTAQSAKSLEMNHREDFKRANSRVHLAYALRGIYSPEADTVRLMIIRDLIPGPFANLTFQTLASHNSSPVIKSGLAELLDVWQLHYDEQKAPSSNSPLQLRVYRGERSQKSSN